MRGRCRRWWLRREGGHWGRGCRGQMSGNAGFLPGLGCGSCLQDLSDTLALNFSNTPVEPETFCCLVHCVSLHTEEILNRPLWDEGINEKVQNGMIGIKGSIPIQDRCCFYENLFFFSHKFRDQLTSQIRAQGLLCDLLLALGVS